MDRKGIRVTALAPGFCRSEMTKEIEGEYLERPARDRLVAGRIGDADEAGTALVFLASDAASYISGVTLRSTEGC